MTRSDPKSDDLKKRLDALFSNVEKAELPQAEPLQRIESATSALEADDAQIFQLAYANLAIASALTGLNGRFLMTNRAFDELLGYEEGELAGRSFQEVTYPEDASIGAEALRAMLSGEANSAQFEKRYLRKDGGLVWVQLNVTLLRDENGAARHFVALVRDVSPQIRMAGMLEKRVRELNCLSEIGHRIDEKPPLDEFLEWVTGRIPDAFQYPELCVAAIEYSGRVYGQAEALSLPSKTVGGLRAGGNLLGWLHVAYRETRDFVDAESALVGSIVSRLSGYIDSAQKQAQVEQALASSEHRLLRTLIDNLPAYVFVKDRQGRFLINNLAHLQTCGLHSQEEALGKSDFDFFPQEDAAQYHAAEQALMESGKPLLNYSESVIHQTTGQHVLLSTSKIPLRDERGEVMGLVGINYDVTREREAEARLARRAAELAAVAEVSTAVTAQLDPGHLLQEVVDLTCKRFGLYHAQVYLLEANGGGADDLGLRLAAGAGEAGSQMVAEGWRIALDSERSLVARAARDRMAVVVNEVRADVGFLPNPLLPDTRAELAVPLSSGEQLLGVLDVQSSQAGAFGEEEIAVQSVFAAQIAVALHNARLYKQAQDALDDAEALYQGSARLAAAGSMQGVLEAVVASTALRQMERANVLFFDRPWQEGHFPEAMTVAAVWERSGEPSQFPPGISYPFRRFPAFQLLDRDNPTVVSDVMKDERADENLRNLLSSAGMRSLVAFPLRIAGEWIGLITGQSASSLRLSADDVRRANSLMDQAATTAQNLRLARQTQDALREAQDSAQLTRTILDATPDWIFVKDLQHRFVTVNQAFASALGREPEELIGKNDLELGFPEQAVMGDEAQGIAGYWWDDQRVMDTGEALAINAEVNYVNGELHYFDVYKTPLRNAASEAIGLLGFARDVTERERLLLDTGQQAQVLAILNAMSRALTSTLDMAQVLEIIYQYTARLMDTANFFVALYDEAQGLVSFPVAYSDGLPVAIDARPLSNGLTDHIIRHRRPLLLNGADGIHSQTAALGIDVMYYADDEQALSWLGVPMTYGEQILGVLSVQSVTTPDLYTERQQDMLLAVASQAANAFAIARQYQQTQQALAEARQAQLLMRSIIDATPDWIFVKDRDYRFMLVNRSFADMMHLPAEEFPGKDDYAFFPEELILGDSEKGIKGFRSDDQRVLETGETVAIPREPVMVDGALRYLNTVKVPLRDENGQVWGALGFGRDITELEGLISQVEQQARTLQVLNEFGLALTADLDVESMAQVVRDYTARLMDATNFYLALYDPASGMVSFPLMIFGDERLQADTRPLANRGFTDYILRERKAVLLSDQVDEGRLGLGISFSALVDEEPSKSWLGVPMLYGDQAIGVIAVQSVTTPGLYTARERDLLAALANQAANAFVLQRQYQQTQAALATTQTIYAASRALVGAASPSEVLDALVAATSLSRFERASLILYERPWQETMPERAIFAASWERDESVPHRSVPPGMAVPMSQVDFASLLSRDKATIISDIASDARLSEPARQMLTQLGVGQSLALFPLFVGRQSIGVVSLSADQSVTFDEDELLQIESLVGEAAAVLQSMQLLQQAESRLRREQVLREITAQVRASSDAEVILRSAVRQLGEALGRQAFVQLAAEDRRAMPGSGQEIDPGGR